MRAMLLGIGAAAIFGTAAAAYTDYDIDQMNRDYEQFMLKERMDRIEEQQRQREFERSLDEISRPPHPPDRY